MKEQASKEGNLNPMYGRRHSIETLKKISDSQKQRYQAIRRAISESDILQMADTSDSARSGLIKLLLDKNDLKFDNIQQVLTFLSIMLGKDNVKKVVKEEINRFMQALEQG